MRTMLFVAVVVFAVALGAVQLASSAAYGDLAAHPSLPALLHDRSPGLWRPVLGGPQARAAAALHDGDLDEAQRLITGLADDPGSDDLRGRLAEARGDRRGAVAAYVRAGDVVRAETLIDAASASDPAAALADQERLIARMRGDGRAGEVLGQAWWRLGQLQAAAGYRDPGMRTVRWREAQRSYERALELGPNEETYLLAAGYQSLANGDVAASRRWYGRAADVVPNSADAYAGLAWDAALLGDCNAARAHLARARALRGPGAAVPDPTRNPIAGAALRRCAA